MYCTLCDNVVNEMMKYIPNFKLNLNKINKIDKICTNIPNQFWKEIKALGPYKQKTIPLLVRIDKQIIGTL